MPKTSVGTLGCARRIAYVCAVLRVIEDRRLLDKSISRTKEITSHWQQMISASKRTLAQIKKVVTLSPTRFAGFSYFFYVQRGSVA